MRITYHPAAIDDFAGAASYYDSKQSGLGLGLDFAREVDRVVARIVQTPELYACVKKDILRAPVKRFPYSLYYRHLAGEIRILAIKHHSRRPDYGLDRE